MKAGAGCVKLEGGVTMAETIDAIARVDIPVVGHIGLTPRATTGWVATRSRDGAPAARQGAATG